MCGIARDDTHINQRVQAMTFTTTYKSYHTKIPAIKIHTYDVYYKLIQLFFEETKSEAASKLYN